MQALVQGQLLPACRNSSRGSLQEQQQRQLAEEQQAPAQSKHQAACMLQTQQQLADIPAKHAANTCRKLGSSCNSTAAAQRHADATAHMMCINLAKAWQAACMMCSTALAGTQCMPRRWTLLLLLLQAALLDTGHSAYSRATGNAACRHLTKQSKFACTPAGCMVQGAMAAAAQQHLAVN